jgi:hypothetical protein
MSTPQNFEVDTSDYLGFQYEEYLNELMSIAVSKPSQYYKMRSDTLKELKQVVVKTVYNTYYNLLTKGTVDGKEPLGDLIPHYPQQKASQFALGASKTINDILNSALDIILPPNHLDVAKLKLTQKGEAAKIEA